MGAELEVDFVVYLGDPDDGAEAIESRAAIALENIGQRLDWPDVYGAITVREKGEPVLSLRPDPLFSLVTNTVKALPYVIEGEAETVLLAESEHGLLLEPAGNDAMVSFFVGDPYEPESFLLEPKSVPLGELGTQVLGMGERLRDLMRASDPQIFDRDDYSGSLLNFLEEGRDRLKTFELKVERGLRVE
ncbi:MAG: hypothetical protein AAGD10_05185 [Myxococcota bacterium]